MLGRSFLCLLSAIYLIGIPGFAADTAANAASTQQEAKVKDKKSKKDKKEKSSSDTEQKPAETQSTEKKEDAPKNSVGNKPPVLDPSRFFGGAMMGYAAAKAVPEVIDKLFCYCGCDITDKHSTLLDCFTSIHGVDCHICQEEAVLALKLFRSDTPMADIQRTIDEKYSEQYPFEEDSPTYKKYKANTLYKASGMIDTSAAEKKPGGQISDTAAGPEVPADEKGKTWKPVLKPGKTPSKCCSANHDEAKDNKGKGK